MYSASLGVQGLVADAPGTVSRVFFEDALVANAALALHMFAGALLTIGAPLQALPILRRRWPAVHRRSGYVLFGLAIVTGPGGFVYILIKGTVGGWWMSLWFAIYGGALIWAAAATIYHAIDKNRPQHFAWATRLVILAVGSWIYRMHYGIWYGLTDGLGSNSAFTGPFDQIQVFAFYVPYLLVAEVFLRRRLRRRALR
ncbi:MAG: DUF2306 domain-containing protein [Paracoccaceae bacterium]|nr:DUF2306 domain-containing protein [Paracoccaceae bacterium]